MVVSKASNTTEATSSKTMGLIAQNLSTNGKGFVITEGLLAGLDTGSTVAGAPVWLGTNGNLIYGLVGKPFAPAHLVFIGIVTRANNNNGEIFVKVQNGFELNEIHDVDLKSILPTDGQVLQFDGATGLWKNKTLATGLTVGTTAIASGTDGRVLFQSAGVLQQSAIFFWDNTNSRLGVGTSSPASRLDITAQGALSTDLAIRIRNSANTSDILKIAGNGQSVLFNNSTGSSLSSMDSTNTFAAVSLENFSLVNTTFKKVLGIQSYAGSGMRYLTMSNLDDLHWSHRFTIAGRLTTPAGIASVSTSNDFNSSTIVNLYGVNLINQASVSMRPDFNLAQNENTLGLFIAPSSTLNPTKKLIKLMDSTLTTTYFTVNGSGQTGIGTDTPTARLHIAAQGALSTDIAFRVRNSANTADLFSVNGTGGFESTYFWSFKRLNGTTLELYSLTTGFSFREGGVPFALLGLNESKFGNTNTNDSVLAIRTSTAYGGEYPLGSILQGGGINGSVVLSPSNGVANKCMLGYYNGTSWVSALEYNNTASGGTVVKLVQNGSGAVSIGQSTNGARLDVKAQGALSTDLAFRIRNSANTADLFNIQGNGITNVSTLTASNQINITQPAGLYYPTIAFTANGTQSCGTIEGYNSGLYIRNTAYLNLNSPSVYVGGYGTGVASAVFTVTSTTKGFLPPRMTNAQRLLISTPAVGLMVYCTDVVEGLYIYKSTGWVFVI
jgi:hypothetical protein